MARPTDPWRTFQHAQPPGWQLVLALLALFLIAALWQATMTSGPRELSYSAFKEQVRRGRVAEVTIEGDQIRGRLKAAPQRDDQQKGSSGSASKSVGTDGSDAPSEQEETQDTADDATPSGAAAFVTTKPRVEDPRLLALLEEHGVTVNAMSPEPSWWQRAIVGLLPWLLILGVIVYISYRMRQRLSGGEGGPGGVFGFAKSKAKRFRKELSQTTLEDVAGLANAKGDLKEIIDNLSHPERYRTIGAKIPRGVLLVGPPGTGKTLLAEALLEEETIDRPRIEELLRAGEVEPARIGTGG